MSYYTTPTGDRIELFGHGGGKAEAARQNVSFLGEIPIYVSIREGGDAGQPIVVTDPDSRAGQSFLDVAINVRRQLTK
jgi:ATP-binding protein involved in chromosome partitioning